jgi:hypothetical protein
MNSYGISWDELYIHNLFGFLIGYIITRNWDDLIIDHGKWGCSMGIYSQQYSIWGCLKMGELAPKSTAILFGQC